MENLSHIELFAGCGGMSLGLDAAGFKLYFANELSPMAGETFSYNLLREDLQDLAKKEKSAEKVLWIKSKYDCQNLKNRLRENPFDYDEGNYSDLDKKTVLEGKLLIGNINHLLNFLAQNKNICKKLRKENIDLVSGGPPCQSFSLAGRREKDNHKNLLPLSFARFAGLVKPKIVLLENVKGITSAFSIGNEKYYAWLEVSKAFCLEGFVPVCMMVNSKFFGIPQNRPRFILLAIRKDIVEQLIRIEQDETTLNTLNSSFNFFNLVRKNRRSLNKITKVSLKIYDIEKQPSLFNGNFFPSIITGKENFISSKEAIDDLLITDTSSVIVRTPSNYVNTLNALFKTKKRIGANQIKNHDIRRHSFDVRARFRWFQVLSNLNGLSPYALKLLSGQYDDQEKTRLIFEKIRKEQLLIKEGANGRLIKIDNQQAFTNYIKSIQTKKHSQRALKASEPAPAQLTIPDDLCHYSSHELRTLTVREMARFQSFPDWFEFRSKVTTGGQQRKFEVPQYTQVGNAVPPILAYEIGKTISKILKSVQ